jgi:hypothetical protein
MRYADEGLEEDLGHIRFDKTTLLVVECFASRGLRLDEHSVRRWSREDEEAARAWVDGGGDVPEPPVIAAARAEYARAKKCRRCGCTEFYRCHGGCTLDGDVCTRCG